MKKKNTFMKILAIMLLFVIAGVIYVSVTDSQSEAEASEEGITAGEDSLTQLQDDSQAGTGSRSSGEDENASFSEDLAAVSAQDDDASAAQAAGTETGLPVTGSLEDGQEAEDGTDAYLQETERLLCVHVCGAVNSPGVYYLAEGSRAHNAVEMAGGLTADAADEYVNLAREISDGKQIYIPTRTEVDTDSVPVLPEADYEVSETAQQDDGRININTASLSELATLPGIGESKAEAIIAYRENVAAFESPEDIMNVAGIKDTVYEKIKDYIKVK